MTKKYNPPTKEALINDVDSIRTMLTDIMLPAAFQAKPNQFVRAKLKEALASNKYDNKVTGQVMRNALRWPRPLDWLRKTFNEFMDAKET